MIIVGGVYQERCQFPRWDRIFGSGLRAALALSELSRGVELHGYVPPELAADVAATLASFGVSHSLRPSSTAITFSYMHSFEKTGWSPTKPRQERPFSVSGDAVLRFGLMEGDAIVTARRAVYDPQSPKPTSFAANGSRADELVIVGSVTDITALADIEPDKPETHGEDTIRDALTRLFDTDNALRAVLLKDALGNLTAYDGDEGFPISAYAAESYFRIGAGDIIAAGFAYAWAVERRTIREAADFAARCTAFAVEGPRIPLDRAGIENVKPAPSLVAHKLRIVGCDTLELKTLAIHAKSWIELLGGRATIDEKLDGPHVTLVLVGDERRPKLLRQLSDTCRNGPFVLYWPVAEPGEPQYWFGDVIHTRDFATALYRALRMPSG